MAALEYHSDPRGTPGFTVPIATPAGTSANIRPVVPALALVDSGGNDISAQLSGADYEAVAASAANQALGATGAAGDFLNGLLIVPATTSPGAVSIKDGGGSAITVFAGGATSVGSLVSFFVPLGIKSLAGAWQVTTGASVSVIGVGKFT